MRNAKSNRYEPHGRAEHQDPHAGGGLSPLLQRLMQKITGQRQDQERARGAAPSLSPAGRRSGSGADSLTPYMDETRNSRPAPLE